MTYDAARKPARHQSEANKQEEACAPDCPRIPEALVAAHAVLVDEVDDEHAEERRDAREPVDEANVYGRRDVGLADRRVCVRG